MQVIHLLALRMYRRWRTEMWFWRGCHDPVEQSPEVLPLAVRAKLYTRGFFPSAYLGYGFDKRDDWNSFLSDRQLIMSQRINGASSIVLDDKQLFALAAQDIIRTPRVFLAIRNGRPAWLCEEGESRDLIDLIERHGKLVIKPIVGMRGAGVSLLKSHDGDLLLDGQPVQADTIVSRVFQADDALVVEHIEQGKFGSNVYPGSLNTLRLITMIDPDNGEAFLAEAAHRFGTNESSPVDNISRGGLCCQVDLDTGRLGDALLCDPVSGHVWHDRHPDTGALFRDHTVPDWRGVVDEVLSAASMLRRTPYIGWDIAITEDGICAIEANSWSGTYPFQLSRPWLSNARIRRFFEYHRIVRAGRKGVARACTEDGAGMDLRATRTLCARLKRRYHDARRRFYYHRAARMPENQELMAPVSRSLRRKLIHLGFFPNKHEAYGFDSRTDWIDFLSDRDMIRSSLIDGVYSRVLDDKMLYALTLKDIVPMPKAFMAVLDGVPVGLHDTADATDPRILLERERTLFVKPVIGSGGRCVCRLDMKEGRCHLDGEEIGDQELYDLIFRSGDILVLESVEQGEFSRHVYPGSANTLRMLTMIDPDNGEAFLGAAGHRFGTDKSAPTDNTSKGGICCEVDVDTGRLGDGVPYAYPHEEIRVFECHPQTNVRFRDLAVPGWDEVVGDTLRVASRLQMLPYIGWDIVVTDDGICAIEANHWSGTHPFQLSRPWLANPRIRRFFEYHGIV